MQKKKILYSVLIVIFIIFIGICSFFSFYFYDLLNKNAIKKELFLNEGNKMSFSFILNDSNKVFASEEISNYKINDINRINVFLNYNLSSSDILDGKYTYYSVGSLIMKGQKDVELSREIVRTNPSVLSMKDDLIVLNVEENINISDYLNDYQELQNIYDTNDFYIKYDTYINYNTYSKYIERNIKDNKVYSTTIPLTKELNAIIQSHDNIEEKIETSNTDLNKNIYLVILLEFLGASLLFVLLIIYFLRKMFSLETPFDIKINRILKNNSDSIIEIINLPDLSKLEVLFTNNVNDLVSISNTMGTPINYYKFSDSTRIFILIKDTRAYVYKLEKDI